MLSRPERNEWELRRGLSIPISKPSTVHPNVQYKKRSQACPNRFILVHSNFFKSSSKRIPKKWLRCKHISKETDVSEMAERRQQRSEEADAGSPEDPNLPCPSH